ncbi:hypothetical protein [Pseudalkalibacillus hwajinpoensis]|uniref:hypothetical protein n=1 Tax=Guptibacillus hwajinpoensis TaxID=208199 RepID=UPI001CD3D344|nr:hypothetical protein [Pseudalkalibacillus hwajinpoensis]MCA0992123.1 hypothetical protein [Pseudalkalibacillus hwajinpoensis]
MKQKLNKVILPVLLLSFALNVFFISYYFYEKKREEERLGQAINYIMFNMNESVNLINEIDKNHPEYKDRLILAQNKVAENEGLINAHIKEMPQNLVSWNGGIGVGLGNGIYGVSEKGAAEAVEDLLNFKKGYDKEIQHVNPEDRPYEAIEVIENVLSSKKYMGERFIYK